MYRKCVLLSPFAVYDPAAGVAAAGPLSYNEQKALVDSQSVMRVNVLLSGRYAAFQLTLMLAEN